MASHKPHIKMATITAAITLGAALPCSATSSAAPLMESSNVVGAAVPVAIVEADGGVWDRGTTTGLVWSNYHHNDRIHGTTAIGSTTDRSPNVLPGQWAEAEAEASWFGGNQAYYRVF